MPATAACSNEEMIPVTAAPVTSSGAPAQIDGALTVTVQSGDGSVSQDAASPLTFNAVSGSAPGDTVYLVEADADLGAGVVTLQDTFTLTVTSATAASFGLSAGAAVPKPAGPAPSAARRRR
jgi:hypothetical protein